MNLPLRRAKIVATLGPSSSTLEAIISLIQSGVNVFRLNFSHGTHQDHAKRFELIKEASKKTKRPVAVLQDLQGPKLRVGKFQNGSIKIISGTDVTLFLEKEKQKASSAANMIPYNYENLANEIKIGHRIMLDDGNLELKVTSISAQDHRIEANVVFGGELKDHKGMNFPDTTISIGSFTKQDKDDAEFGLKLGVDYIALSFVRSADDIKTLRKCIEDHKKTTPIVAKIEKSEAITNLESILTATDAVMVARGDLAVEVGTAQVPLLQKHIIRLANERGIPVITATQMLESMINSPRPTRAEASDVANAILDGTDAVMLSAETASGKFPSETVKMMSNIIIETESKAFKEHISQPGDLNTKNDVNLVDAIEHAAAHLATWIKAKAIACTTHTGQAAMALSRYRPHVPIIAFTDQSAIARKLALVWGVETLPIEPNTDLEKIFLFAERELARYKIAKKGDLVVLTAGFPPLQHGTTNLMKVVNVRSDYVENA